MERTVAFVSLGCDKNLVDSEVMLGILDQEGYRIIDNESEAEVLIVNTCAFIKDAIQESIDTILEVADHKKSGNCKALIVTGCLAERYREEIMKEIPEVDAVLGAGDYIGIGEAIQRVHQGEKVIKVDAINRDINEFEAPRMISTLGSYAYLKIAEGCDNYCTYCIIPKLRGKYRSRKMESLISEAKMLVDNGVREIIIVAQDTTRYGIDLYGEKMLPQLLKELSKLDDLKWIRLMYCYPEEITDELIEVIASDPKVCHYIDMPIQHSSNTVLKRMGRKSRREELIELIQKMRKKIPDMIIRTSLIVGFPGETEEEFQDLCGFLEEVRLDRAGVFTYSHEEDTAAYNMENQIDETVKEVRKNKIMELQQQISFKKNEEKVGTVLEVMIEGKLAEEDVYCSRSYGDAPEIDGAVFVAAEENLIAGDFVTVQITNSYEYDLIGEIYDELSE